MTRTLSEHWGALLAPPWDAAVQAFVPQPFRQIAKARPRNAAIMPDMATPPALGRVGSLEIRLAKGGGEIRRAQRLRYKVFYEEMSALAHPMKQFMRLDYDAFDAVCDHLLVVDRAQGFFNTRPKKVVGTYRLITQAAARSRGGFYTAGEYDLAPLLQNQADRRFLELGRSCVLPSYRNKRTIELLWRGIWAYVQRHQVDVLIGCASFEGTKPDELALPLSFLHHHASAPPEWQVRAHPHRYVEMNRLPKRRIDTKRALRELPPLIKAYLRVGAFIGSGAVVDRKFGTTDVCIILPVSRIKARYLDHFGGGPDTLAA